MPTFYEYTTKSFGHKVNKSARLMNYRLVRNFREHNYDVTLEQYQLLMYLWVKDGVTQNYLAQLTGKDEPSISRIINTLEKRNLVIRTRHPHDRRTNLIYVTENGRCLRDGLTAMGAKTIKQVTEGVDSNDLTICIRVLDKVLDNLLRLV